MFNLLAYFLHISEKVTKLLGVLYLYLSLNGSTALVGLDRFFSFLIYTQSVGLLGRGISPSQGRYLLRGLSPQAIYTTERPPLVGEVSANFCG
jgi:hypothetical protein